MCDGVWHFFGGDGWGARERYGDLSTYTQYGIISGDQKNTGTKNHPQIPLMNDIM